MLVLIYLFGLFLTLNLKKAHFVVPLPGLLVAQVPVCWVPWEITSQRAVTLHPQGAIPGHCITALSVLESAKGALEFTGWGHRRAGISLQPLTLAQGPGS